MSVIVKHRTDLDTVAARVGVALQQDQMPPSRQKPRDLRRHPRPAARQPRRPAPLVRRGPPKRGRRDRHLGDPRRVRGAEPRRMGRPARLQGGAGHHARQIERRPESVRSRVRPVLLPRHRGPGGAASEITEANADDGPPSDINLDTLAPADRRRAQGRLGRRAQGPRPPRDRRVRPRRGLGRPRRRRAADQTRPRPQNRAPARPPGQTTPATTASHEISSENSSSTSGASSSET